MASGYYHRRNFLKFRILQCLFENDAVYSNTAMTCAEIAEAIGIEQKKVAGAVSCYSVRGYPYLSRLEKKRGHAYKYKLTKKGVMWYLVYANRIKHGSSLNCKDKQNRIRYKTPKDLRVSPAQMECYLGLTKQGVLELGLKREDISKVAGLQKG